MATKDVGIRIRVERELRDAFVDACHADEKQASDVLRDFMRNYANTALSMRQVDMFDVSGEKGGAESVTSTLGT